MRKLQMAPGLQYFFLLNVLIDVHYVSVKNSLFSFAGYIKMSCVAHKWEILVDESFQVYNASLHVHVKLFQDFDNDFPAWNKYLQPCRYQASLHTFYMSEPCSTTVGFSNFMTSLLPSSITLIISSPTIVLLLSWWRYFIKPNYCITLLMNGCLKKN